MRDLNDPTLAEILAHNGQQARIVLVTISAEGFSTGRYCRNNEPITSRGNVFTPLRMAVELPDEGNTKESQGKITIDNVSQALVEMIRNTFGGVDVTLEEVLSGDVDTVIAGPFPLTGRNISINRMNISMDLFYEDVLNLAFPRDRFTPSTTPGLFEFAEITSTPGG